MKVTVFQLAYIAIFIIGIMTVLINSTMKPYFSLYDVTYNLGWGLISLFICLLAVDCWVLVISLKPKDSIQCYKCSRTSSITLDGLECCEEHHKKLVDKLGKTKHV